MVAQISIHQAADIYRMPPLPPHVPLPSFPPPVTASWCASAHTGVIDYRSINTYKHNTLE